MIEITAVRDRNRVIFGQRARPKWESSSFGMVLAETTSAHIGILRTQLRRTYGIASIVPESDEAYYDSQPEAFISVSVRPYLCLHNDHRNTDVQ